MNLPGEARKRVEMAKEELRPLQEDSEIKVETLEAFETIYAGVLGLDAVLNRVHEGYIQLELYRDVKKEIKDVREELYKNQVYREEIANSIRVLKSNISLMRDCYVGELSRADNFLKNLGVTDKERQEVRAEILTEIPLHPKVLQKNAGKGGGLNES